MENSYSPPSWLDREAKKEWKRVIQKLTEDDSIKECDLSALEGYCQSYSRWKKAEQVLQKEGLTFTTPNGYWQQRPEVSIANKALAEVRAFCKEFGLTPASRARIEKNIGAEQNNENDDDKEMEDMIQK